MMCPNCGKDIPSGSLLCVYCKKVLVGGGGGGGGAAKPIITAVVTIGIIIFIIAKIIPAKTEEPSLAAKSNITSAVVSKVQSTPATTQQTTIVTSAVSKASVTTTIDTTAETTVTETSTPLETTLETTTESIKDINSQWISLCATYPELANRNAIDLFIQEFGEITGLYGDNYDFENSYDKDDNFQGDFMNYSKKDPNFPYVFVFKKHLYIPSTAENLWDVTPQTLYIRNKAPIGTPILPLVTVGISLKDLEQCLEVSLPALNSSTITYELLPNDPGDGYRHLEAVYTEANGQGYIIDFVLEIVDTLQVKYATITKQPMPYEEVTSIERLYGTWRNNNGVEFVISPQSISRTSYRFGSYDKNEYYENFYIIKQHYGPGDEGIMFSVPVGGDGNTIYEINRRANTHRYAVNFTHTRISDEY